VPLNWIEKPHATLRKIIYLIGIGQGRFLDGALAKGWATSSSGLALRESSSCHWTRRSRGFLRLEYDIFSSRRKR
jgi:hypothetical protein